MGRKAIAEGGRAKVHINVSHPDPLRSAEIARHVARLEAQRPDEWVEPALGADGRANGNGRRWLDVAIRAAALLALKRRCSLLEILREWEQLDTIEIHDSDDDDHLGGAA